MAPKQPRTEGLSKTQEHRQINKHLNRPRKHHAPIAKKILATDRYLKQAKTAREVENELGIPKSSVVRIAAQARQRAAENNRPLQDIANYEEAPGRGRREVFSSSQADALAKYVVSCRDCRMKTAEQHIVDLELPISVSTFQNVIAVMLGHESRNVLFCYYDITTQRDHEPLLPRRDSGTELPEAKSSRKSGDNTSYLVACFGQSWYSGFVALEASIGRCHFFHDVFDHVSMFTVCATLPEHVAGPWEV